MKNQRPIWCSMRTFRERTSFILFSAFCHRLDNGFGMQMIKNAIAEWSDHVDEVRDGVHFRAGDDWWLEFRFHA